MRAYTPQLDWDGLALLARAARGLVKADLVVKGCTLVNVYTCELEEGVDVAVKRGFIVLVGDASKLVGSETRVIDARGMYLCPGFLDAHVHVESSMLTLSEFAKAVLPHGTTGIFMDPHEIANVLGYKGLKFLAEEAGMVPLRVFMEVPSCVPASRFDSPGAVLGVEEVARALDRIPNAIALGEVMDYPSVVNGSREVLEKIAATRRRGLLVEGHAPLLTGPDLCAYVAVGISSCHESTTWGEGLEKLRRGMYLMVREGSAWRDVRDVLGGLVRRGVDLSRVLLCTDDRHPLDILEEGHMDYVVRRAIEEGVDPVVAVRMATLNTATRFRLDDLLGGVAPGRLADMVLLEDLEGVKVKMTIFNGEVVAVDGRVVGGSWWPRVRYPRYVYETVRLPRRSTPCDFKVGAPLTDGLVRVRVIGVTPGKAVTEHLVEDVEACDGELPADPSRGLVKVAVVERHSGSGRMAVGFARGLGISRGAIATSVAHDSHNIVVAGASDEDMALAVNEVAAMRGGLVVVLNGRVLARLELPIAGILSDRPLEEVCSKLRRVAEACRVLGSEVKDPFMSLSLIALPVIPHLRITDRGLVDVDRGVFTSLIVEEGRR